MEKVKVVEIEIEAETKAMLDRRRRFPEQSYSEIIQELIKEWMKKKQKRRRLTKTKNKTISLMLNFPP